MDMKFNGMWLWGIVVYSVAIFSSSLLIEFDLFDGALPLLSDIFSMAVVSYAGSRLLDVRTLRAVVPYALVWVGTVIGIDVLFHLPYEGLIFFASGNIVAIYVGVFLAPFFALYPHFGRSTSSL